MKSPRPLQLRRFAARTLLPALLVSFAAAGCIKVKLTVQMNEDGAGEVAEEIVFGEKLVNVAARSGAGGDQPLPSIATMTGEPYVKQRVARMGKGVRLVDRKVEERPDGSVRMQCRYSYDDINQLRISPFPFGFGWEDYYIRFSYSVATDLAMDYTLRARLGNLMDRKAIDQGRQVETPPLGELEAQQIRALLPIFKDLLDGFELKLDMKVFERDKWASATKGHLGAGGRLGAGGGKLTLYHVTDRHLASSDDGLLMLVPWRQVGREVELHQLMPHVNDMYYDLRYQGFLMQWRAFETPAGREYY